MKAFKHLSKDALAEVFTLAFAEAFLTLALAALAATALTALFLLLAAATALALEAGALAAAAALALETGALAAAADFADLLPKCLTNANGTLADLILLKSKLKFGNKVQWLYWADNCSKYSMRLLVSFYYQNLTWFSPLIISLLCFYHTNIY